MSNIDNLESSIDENVLMKIKYDIYSREDENEKTNKKTSGEMVKEIKDIIKSAVNGKNF